MMLICSLLLSAGLAYGITIDPGLYGHLNQNNTDFCKDAQGNSLACGPVATVNSMLMLDNRYGSSLIGDRDFDFDVDNDDLAIVAGTLAGADYMGCTPCQGGTTVANLIAGKRRYLNEEAPGMYYVHSRFQPTFEWFFNELRNGQDIELLVGFYDANNQRLGGHYVTVNGIDWTDANNNGIIDGAEGTISFIDPFAPVGQDAQDTNALIYNFLGGSLGTTYNVGGATITTSLEWGIAESPVPEPHTAVLVVAGVAFLLWRRQANVQRPF